MKIKKFVIKFSVVILFLTMIIIISNIFILNRRTVIFLKNKNQNLLACKLSETIYFFKGDNESLTNVIFDYENLTPINYDKIKQYTTLILATNEYKNDPVYIMNYAECLYFEGKIDEYYDLTEPYSNEIKNKSEKSMRFVFHIIHPIIIDKNANNDDTCFAIELLECARGSKYGSILLSSFYIDSQLSIFYRKINNVQKSEEYKNKVTEDVSNLNYDKKAQEEMLDAFKKKLLGVD